MVRWGVLLVVAACSFRPQASSVDGGVLPDTAVDTPPAPAHGKRIQLTIDNGARATELDDFPLLVVLDAARVDFADFAPGSSDVRFFDAGGTALDFEIDTWSTDHAYLWVRVPAIAASSSTGFVWMYYNDPSAAGGANPSGVWGSAYEGVWHLGTDPTAGAGTIHDSTSHARHLSATANLPASALGAGQVGQALHFAGTTENVQLATGIPLATYTWSAWANADTVPLIGQGNDDVISDGDVNFNFCWSHNDPTFAGAAAQFDGAWHPDGVGAASLEAMRWYHLAATFDGSHLCVFLDGAPGPCVASNTPNTPSGSFAIGGTHVGADDNTFPGSVDEVHVESVARPAAWIDAEHASGVDAMIAYGAVQAVP